MRVCSFLQRTTSRQEMCVCMPNMCVNETTCMCGSVCVGRAEKDS
jgi:hypothetical protein